MFVILVIFQHWSQYVELNGIYDEPYLVLQAHLNQMIVAMFLFYSGYGMMESTKAKGIAYIKGIPGKRLLTVLVNFDIAVLIFFVVKSILGETFQVSTILFSLITCSPSIFPPRAKTTQARVISAGVTPIAQARV